MLTGKQLRSYLAYAVHGTQTPPDEAPARKPVRKARTSARRGPERDEDYKAWVRLHPCAACASEREIEAAHTGSDGGMSMKASDSSCIPLCGSCHRTGRRAYHVIGKREFERVWGIDCARVVRKLNAEWKRRAA